MEIQYVEKTNANTDGENNYLAKPLEKLMSQ